MTTLVEWSEIIRNGVLALVAALALPFTLWRLRISNKQAMTAEQGHITDRFTSAVEQLGATRPGQNGDSEPNIEVRIGAIYALERIAQDSERDHWAIMSILTAYIRANSKFDSLLNENVAPPEIQAIADIISRRNWVETEPHGLDFSGACLNGCRFVGAFLANADFYKCALAQADFTDADLSKANMADANLRGAILLGAKLQAVDFTNTHVKFAVFDDDVESRFLVLARD